ncbi:MAG: arginine--tRNA ligase [Armatimonadota bacterium]
MIEDRVRSLLQQALDRCVADGVLPREAAGDIALDRPPRAELGDLSSNLALTTAPRADMSPRELAQALLDRLEAPADLVREVSVAGPGFLNFFLHPTWLWQSLAEMLRRPDQYGRSDLGRGKRVNVEFVSANPVGPLHIGNARGGPLGDALASLLEWTGHRVTREYLVNDGPDNTQLLLFGKSVKLRYLEALGRQVEFPQDWYGADYVKRYAQLIVERHGEAYADDERPDLFYADLVLEDVVEDLRRDCAAVGIEFDVWFHERSLLESAEVDRVYARLHELAATYEKDDALWLKTTDHGDDEDRVVRRRTGATTYLITDAAYHASKFERGHELLIDVWGPDHHGHVLPTKAAVACLGYPEEDFEIIMHQTVRLMRGGEVVKMSKRRGEVVTLRELVEEVGPDVTRFFFLMRSSDAHLDFDLDLAVERSEKNPVYYVQYAHARMCSIFREAQERGVELEPATAPLERLEHEDELALLRRLADFPGEVASAARSRAPHRLTGYVRELAADFHQFYTSCRVLGDDADLTQARLALLRGTQIVLRNALSILGISAPERM